MDPEVMKFAEEALQHGLVLRAASPSPGRLGFDLLATAGHLDPGVDARLLHRRSCWHVLPSANHAGGVAAQDVVVESVGGRLEVRSTVRSERSTELGTVKADLVSYFSLGTTEAILLAGGGANLEVVRHWVRLHVTGADGRTHVYGLPGADERSGGSTDLKSTSDCDCALSCWTLSGLSPELEEMVASAMPCLLKALPFCAFEISLGLPPLMCGKALALCGEGLALEMFVAWLLDSAIAIGSCLGQCELAGTWDPEFIEQSQPMLSPNPASPGASVQVSGTAKYLDTCKYVESGNAEIELYDEFGPILVKNVEIKDGFYQTYVTAPSTPKQYGIQSAATTNDYTLRSTSITSNLLIVSATASGIDVDIEVLSPNPAEAGQPVTIKGSAAYDTGQPVLAGTAKVAAGGTMWTTPVSNGVFMHVFPAPGSDALVAVNVTDGALQGATSKYLTVEVDGGGSGWTFGTSLMCLDAQEVDPWDPIHPKEGFSKSDPKVCAWIELFDVNVPVRCKWEWFTPEGVLLYANVGDWKNPPPGGWAWLKQSWFHWFAGTGMLNYPGKWFVSMSVDDGNGWHHVATNTFVARYELVDHLTCKDVDDEAPYDPHGVTVAFDQKDTEVFSWLRMEEVSESLNLRWKFYEPNGSLYATYDDTTDPPPGASDTWGWYKATKAIAVSGASAASKCGDWKVEVLVQSAFGQWGDPKYADYFKILESPGVSPALTLDVVPSEPIEGDAITVTVTAMDNTYLQDVELSWNDGSWHSVPLGSSVLDESFTSSYVIGPFVAGQTISLTASATDTSGNIGGAASQLMVQGLPAPDTPENLVYPKVDHDGVYYVQWSASVGATWYELERSANGGSSWQAAAEVPYAAYDEVIGVGFYVYRVRAANSGGASEWKVGSVECKVSPPPAPSWIDYPTVDEDGSYDVSWASSLDATSYELQRSSDEGGSWTVLYWGPDNAIGDAVDSGKHQYRVRGLNGLGEGPWAVGDHSCLVGTVCDSGWFANVGDEEGMWGGVNYGAIRALTKYDEGSGEHLYAGGYFVTAGGITVNHVARWDSQAWTPLGAGMNNVVNKLIVYDDGSGPALIAVGSFTTAGGLPANNIARWDGLQWMPLGGGLNSFTVWALAVYHGKLYVGGGFTAAGGKPANFIAAWDGQEWSAVPGGVNGEVWSMTTADLGGGSKLYVGGNFNYAGGKYVGGIAAFDGSGWSGLGAGLSLPPDVLLEFDDGSGKSLFAGGEFPFAGSVVANGTARWDGSSWHALGTGVDGIVYDLCSINGSVGAELVAVGKFDVAGGAPATNAATWNGTIWSQLDGGVEGNWIRAVASYDDGGGQGLYLGGWISHAGAVGVKQFAKWGCSAVWSDPGCSPKSAKLQSSGPLLKTGQGLVLTLDAASPTAGVGFFFAGSLGLDAAGCGVQLTGIGEVLLSLDPWPPFVQTPLSSGLASFPLYIPGDAAVIGTSLAVQGAYVVLPEFTIGTSNSLQATILQ
jgi:hypothetical protein